MDKNLRLAELKELYRKVQKIVDIFKWISLALVFVFVIYLVIFLGSVANLEKSVVITNVIILSVLLALTLASIAMFIVNRIKVTKIIKEGLSLCNAICEKVGKFKDFTHVEEKIEAPTISNANLFKKCTNSKVRIPVENNTPGATIFYTIDGSEPTSSSNTGNTIVFASGFVGGRDKEEDDKYVVVKVKAVLNGISSITNTYKIRLQKDVKHWIEI